ncbi:MAG: PEGA domain-containing protein [Methanoregula sp.]
MKRFPFLVCLAILLLLVQTGITSAASTATTTTTVPATNTTTATITALERTGGSIFFETDPPGATIWVDRIEIGTSDSTYFSEKTGTRDVLLRKKGYEEYNGTVTVRDGERVVFSAILTPVSRTPPAEDIPAAPVTTVTTIRKSTMSIPTSWPTTSSKSPVDPAVVIVAAVLGIGFSVIRRR